MMAVTIVSQIKDANLMNPASRCMVRTTPEEKHAIANVCGCPINKGCDTRMTKKAFVTMCTRHQETATRMHEGKNNQWRQNTI